MSLQILTYFAKQIESELGIIYSEHNYFQLQNRLDEISKLMGAGSLEELHEQAQKGFTAQFKQLLIDFATNNETSFFRDPKIFRSIESTVLPLFLKRKKPGEKFRIWSAACSSGQEALSLSMTIHEWNDKSTEPVVFQIIATDISERILHKAREGKYSQLEIDRGLSESLRNKYFRPETGSFWKADGILRSSMEFQRLNLKDNFSFREKFDLICCRNVLIYQNVEGKKDILRRIHDCLVPEGVLILGAGESLIGLSESFAQLPVDGAMLYKKSS